MIFCIRLFLLSVLFSVSTSLTARAQFPPQAGITGSTAIPSSDTRFVNWATGCTVQRGYLDIAQPGAGRALAGADILATGAADFQIVSLGDSGVAILTFASPIRNGDGPDFAVFENGFIDPTDPEMAFLELAFVEVSSDGIHYTRFEAVSHTQDSVQIAGAGIYMDASRLHNLAGKYKAGFGTPFDLEELSGTPGLDLNRITHVRLVDVIGAINGSGTTDHEGHTINDPYPTPFPIGTGGFDLDAVGVIHQEASGIPRSSPGNEFSIFPNPVTDRLHIRATGAGNGAKISLTDMTGRIMAMQDLENGNADLLTEAYAPGVYFIVIKNATGTLWTGKISKQ